MTNLCIPGRNVCLVLSRGCTSDMKAKPKRFLGVTLIITIPLNSDSARIIVSQVMSSA